MHVQYLCMPARQLSLSLHCPMFPLLVCLLLPPQASTIAVTAAAVFYFTTSVACYAALGNDVAGEVLDGFDRERPGGAASQSPIYLAHALQSIQVARPAHTAQCQQF